MLKIDLVQGKGRGTVATQPIEKGQLIEAAPTCTLPPAQRQIIDTTTVAQYYFVRPSEYSDINACKSQLNGYLVFGLCSLCNHSTHPNAVVKWVEGEDGLWAHLIALRDIRPDEEITLFYTNIDEYQLANQFIETRNSTDK